MYDRDAPYRRDGGNNVNINDLYGHPETSPSTTNSFAEWLYGEWNEEKLKQYRLLNVIPGISHYMDYLLSVRSDREYMDRNGMDYTDIHDPRKLSATESSKRLYSYGLNFISDNIKRLYK